MSSPTLTRSARKSADAPEWRSGPSYRPDNRTQPDASHCYRLVCATARRADHGAPNNKQKVLPTFAPPGDLAHGPPDCNKDFRKDNRATPNSTVVAWDCIAPAASVAGALHPATSRPQPK